MLERNEKINKRRRSFIQSSRTIEPLRFVPTGHANSVQIAVYLEVTRIGLFFCRSLFYNLILLNYNFLYIKLL